MKLHVTKVSFAFRLNTIYAGTYCQSASFNLKVNEFYLHLIKKITDEFNHEKVTKCNGFRPYIS